jgi:hypothetical protein
MRRWRGERLRDRSQYDKGEHDGNGYSNTNDQVAECNIPLEISEAHVVLDHCSNCSSERKLENSCQPYRDGGKSEKPLLAWHLSRG